MKKIFNIQYELLQTYFHCSLFITFNYLTMLFLGCFHRLSGEVTLVIIYFISVSAQLREKRDAQLPASEVSTRFLYHVIGDL